MPRSSKKSAAGTRLTLSRRFSVYVGLGTRPRMMSFKTIIGHCYNEPTTMPSQGSGTEELFMAKRGVPQREYTRYPSDNGAAGRRLIITAAGINHNSRLRSVVDTMIIGHGRAPSIKIGDRPARTQDILGSIFLIMEDGIYKICSFKESTCKSCLEVVQASGMASHKLGSDCAANRHAYEAYERGYVPCYDTALLSVLTKAGVDTVMVPERFTHYYPKEVATLVKYWDENLSSLRIELDVFLRSTLDDKTPSSNTKQRVKGRKKSKDD